MSKFLSDKSEPTTGTLKLERVGYVPGETINFQAEIQNMTSKVCGAFAKLCMVS
jgi:hypothetical protein